MSLWYPYFAQPLFCYLIVCCWALLWLWAKLLLKSQCKWTFGSQLLKSCWLHKWYSIVKLSGQSCGRWSGIRCCLWVMPLVTGLLSQPFATASTFFHLGSLLTRVRAKETLWLYSNFFKQAILCWEFSRLKASFLFLSGLLQETMAVLTKCDLLGFMCSAYHLRISLTKLHKQQIHLSLPKIWTNMTYISFFQKQFILTGRVKQSGAQVRFKHIYTKDCSWKNGQD